MSEVANIRKRLRELDTERTDLQKRLTTVLAAKRAERDAALAKWPRELTKLNNISVIRDLLEHDGHEKVKLQGRPLQAIIDDAVEDIEDCNAVGFYDVPTCKVFFFENTEENERVIANWKAKPNALMIFAK